MTEHICLHLHHDIDEHILLISLHIYLSFVIQSEEIQSVELNGQITSLILMVFSII